MDQEGATEHPGFGAWVRGQRKALWLTQKRLARLVGCAPVTIQKIEEGHRRPSPVLAEALADQLEIGTQRREAFLKLARSTPIGSRAAGEAPAAGSGTGRVPLTPLIGRTEVLASLRRRLRTPAHRLFTLTGPPGVGKTRLAVQVADGLRGAYADGAWFVPLAVVEDPAQVWPTVARHLGLLDGSADRLTAHLRDRQLLLVLDNFEQVLGASLPLANLLGACSGLRVLVTSRTALRLSGEQEWPLAPLAPAAARQLFAERVRAFDPAFVLSETIGAAVDEIVTRLDRLPLAIELAAVRLRYEPPEDLVARLRNAPLSSLGAGPIDGPPRQHTLERAIAWSYERLEPRLQRVFRRLGVFMGGWSAAAAGPVAGALPGDLEQLLDGHLIRREGTRFGLLETMRAYALHQLDAHQERDDARDAHQATVLTAVLAHQNSDLDWFEAEVGNIRAALQTQLDRDETEAALRLALGTYRFWETRGYQQEGRDWFRAVLERGDRSSMPPELRLLGLNAGSTMAWQSGRFDLSRAWLQDGLRLSRQVGHQEWEARLLMHRGKVELEEGQYRAAAEVLAQALALARRLQQPEQVASVLYQLADVCLCQGELDRADALAAEGLAICREAPGLFWEPPLRLLLGLIALERGAARPAREQMLTALRLVSSTGHRLQVTLILTGLAAASAALQDDRAGLMRSAQVWGCVEAVRTRSGYHWSVAFENRFGCWTARARERLGEADWQRAWTSGRALTLQAAAQLASADPHP